MEYVKTPPQERKKMAYLEKPNIDLDSVDKNSEYDIKSSEYF